MMQFAEERIVDRVGARHIDDEPFELVDTKIDIGAVGAHSG
ncbi:MULTISPECIES: hypothetical protein [unclassified Sphingomonas]|nr:MULTISPECIES: hypothetical protein [unclassified Sphingomonas]TCM03772.1 hypothetical protein C8J41_11031 [Sphingomonas sp. PP-CC-3G-468]